jgi:quercetin dioxygenase-like cupin family protein
MSTHNAAREGVRLNLADELTRLKASAAWQSGDRAVHALVGEPALRLMLVALKAGTSLPEHGAPGHIAIHVIDGELEIGADGEKRVHRPGEVVWLGPDAPHSVRAVTEGAFLLTVAGPRG